MAGIAEAIAHGFQWPKYGGLGVFRPHGYLPEIPILGTPVDTSEWPVGSRAELKRLLAGRSVKG